MVKKRIGTIVDILMYALLLVQMLYIFSGNTLHEIFGILFFLCLIVHLLIKGWWFKTLFKKGKSRGRRFSDTLTAMLLLSVVMLMLSSMGVSRLLFPWFHFFGEADLHRYLATAVLTLGALHGGQHVMKHAKKKGRARLIVILACIASLALGLWAVPYMNRHLLKVEISAGDTVAGEKAEWKGDKPLVVYFTRMGNTDFEADVDAVSGASLLIEDGEMKGSNQLLAEMVCDILDCPAEAVTLSGKHYPSSYNDTIAVAGDELRAKARPAIESIDVSGYDSIILIYPLWWGSIPMPVATFLEQSDLRGKTLYLIISQGSAGFGSTVSEIEELSPGAKVVKGTSIYCEDIPNAREELLELIRSWQ